MAEVSPNLYVSDFVAADTAYVMDMGVMGLGAGRGLAVSTQTWARLPGAAREEIMDDLVRRSAEAGCERLTQWLAAHQEGETNG